MNLRLKICVLVFLLLTIVSCNTEDTLTCLKTTGDEISETYDLESFDKIIVYERIQLIVKDAPEVSVRLETGENLLEDMEVFVEDGVLNVRNNGACNLFRDYDYSKVYVSAPNLTEIRNSSGFTVLSDGVIGWENLALISDDLIEEDFFHKDGDFRMTLDSESVLIQCNGLSNYFLDGSIENLDINLLEGDSRLPLEDLIVQNVIVNHTGTNDIIIAPLQSITGELRSTGNLILKNTPPVVEVDELFTGRVIFD
ncbi:DUF2807 domain-containing protein [Dokdonia sinensis]|uniref:DUF2807 domain-containing protein n=1 Tax=Dokdonia sinensis TaxID=2479847 RepID=A0A3M0GEY1_9FLAO|nr:DUF2807 domain-containing protein [Dokdonia sinensis]